MKKCARCGSDTGIDGRKWKGWTSYCSTCSYGKPHGGFNEQ